MVVSEGSGGSEIDTICSLPVVGATTVEDAVFYTAVGAVAIAGWVAWPTAALIGTAHFAALSTERHSLGRGWRGARRVSSTRRRMSSDDVAVRFRRWSSDRGGYAIVGAVPGRHDTLRVAAEWTWRWLGLVALAAAASRGDYG